MKGDRNDHELAKEISALTSEICGYRQERKNEFDWLRSQCGLATKQDLDRMKECILMKLSELKTEVAGIRAQVTKIWQEQQNKYDALVIEFNTLKASLDNAELPADVVTDLTEFKAQLQAFDDTIPDTTA